MTDEEELARIAEIDFEFVIEKAHRSNLNYWQILKIIVKILNSLMMRSETEYYLKMRNN